MMDASFTLGDLLKLGLHHCADACTEIVDRAQKELLVEKVRGGRGKAGRSTGVGKNGVAREYATAGRAYASSALGGH